MRINLIDVGLKGMMMNALKQLQKYERLAEFAHKAGLYNCARKWSIKAEKLEAVINALENVEKEIKQVEPTKIYIKDNDTTTENGQINFGIDRWIFSLEKEDGFRHADIRELMTPEADEFLRNNFQPGDCINVLGFGCNKGGDVILDEDFNPCHAELVK